jgi:hypothetical protein
MGAESQMVAGVLLLKVGIRLYGGLVEEKPNEEK